MPDTDDKFADWPAMLDELRGLLHQNGREVVVAEQFSGQRETGRFDRIFTGGLVVPEEYARLDPNVELGHEVSTSGPHPFPTPDDAYVPWFHISAPKELPHGIEPLVPSWTSHNRTVLQPDPGFLMTYGLVPRLAPRDQTINWDDPAGPDKNVVQSVPVSVYDYPESNRGYVAIRREFLQDYASLRQRAVLFCFFERRIVVDPALGELLAGAERRELHLPEAQIWLTRIDGSNEISVQIWGRHVFMLPCALPISNRDEDLGELEWVGLRRAVTPQNYRSFSPIDFVYVDDRVLAAYEGNPEFGVHPETGGVVFGSQWAVSYCNRFGRNVIRVEVKKLYEGCPPNVIACWHAQSVPPPKGDVSENLSAPNIGTRARRLVSALISVGEVIADLASAVASCRHTSDEIVGLSRAASEYHGWWNLSGIAPITHHVPLDLPRSRFLSRCKELDRVLVERFSERHLRALLVKLGIPREDVKDYGSLKLLNLICHIAKTSAATGLQWPSEANALIERTLENDIRAPLIPHLVQINRLRQLDAHREGAGADQELAEALEVFGVDIATTAGGFGMALDRVYDCLADELDLLPTMFAQLI